MAAICFARTTLARADVIRGKRVTAGYLNPKFLEGAGGIYTDAPVERDGLIITANGPDASHAFDVETALALAESPAVGGSSKLHPCAADVGPPAKAGWPTRAVRGP